MNASARSCLLRIALLALAIMLLAAACEKKKADPQTVPDLDRTGSSPIGTTQNVLQKNFKVAAPAIFSFEIPAQAAMPHLSGSFKSYAAKVEIQSSQDSANVDFFVLTDDQYAGYTQDGTIDSLFSATASHDQNVDVRLPPSLTQPKKFYLIFRSSPGSDPQKVVKADLSVNF